VSESQGGAGRREVAFRLFAAEYDDSDLSYSESDEERAPNYVVTPTGARVNRVFVVGVLTEVEAVSEDYLRARVVDPTGPFVIYAGQYQPEAMNFLERAEPPLFVAVTGKARTFQPEDSDRVYTSIRPESINEVDAETRDRWVVQAAEQTVERITRVAEAKRTGLDGEALTTALEAHGVEDSLADGIPIALDHYGTTGEYLAALRELALDAARVVAGERDEVAGMNCSPGEATDDPLASLAERPIDTDSVEVEDTDGVDFSDAPEPDGEPTPTDEEIDDAVESTDLSAADDDETVTETGEEPATPVSTGATETEDTHSPSAATDVDTETVEAADSSADADQSADTGDPAADDDLEEFDGEFELDEDERAEIEAEYGTDFQSGSEVEQPGAADIDTPTTEPGVEPDDELPEDTTEATAAAEDDAADAEAEYDERQDDAVSEGADEAALDDAVMDAMVDLDDGDGAEREAVIAEVAEATGADPGDVEDAIQEALMDGRCYEPDDETLKAI